MIVFNICIHSYVFEIKLLKKHIIKYDINHLAKFNKKTSIIQYLHFKITTYTKTKHLVFIIILIVYLLANKKLFK
ncbi:hypothetical protein BFP78_09660 [Gaetbulibacter sp. 5U11]|nr:hypothetical protein BFP78_09660 [Gaetbulibacter sp. 5U11]